MYNNFKDTKTTRAIINLDNIAHNYLYTCKNTDSKVICVIKSDAYGHGAVKVAKRLVKEGANFFAVATIDEALELYENGIEAKILILGFVPCELLQTAVDCGFSIPVYSLESANQIADLKTEKQINVHIKLNTGMNRLGFNVYHNDYSKLSECVDILKTNSNINIEGMFSHFASADENEKFTRKQFSAFVKARDFVVSLGFNPKICHICSSTSTSYKDMSLDGIRLGIYLYGYNTNDENYLPGMEFKTRIIATQTLSKGDCISYGLKFKAKKPTKIAILPIGYADGLKRVLSLSKGYVLCNGRKAKILGRVCMNLTAVDITDIKDAKTGDDITIWGKDKDAFLSCDEVAKNADTISYEMLVSVASRVPKIYIGE